MEPPAEEYNRIIHQTPHQHRQSTNILTNTHRLPAVIKSPEAYSSTNRFCISSKHNQMQQNLTVPETHKHETQNWGLGLYKRMPDEKNKILESQN